MIYKDQSPAGTQEEILRRVQRIAAARGCEMSQVALAWLNARVTAPVIGLSSPERMDQVLEAAHLVLTEAEEKALEEPYRPQPVQGHI